MTHPTPTVFVALILAPDQKALFEELEIEVADILGERDFSYASRISENDDLVFLDRDRLRVAVGWSTTPSGDVLTLALGTPPEASEDETGAQAVSRLMRDLVQCAQALFDVRQTLWQVAQVSLSSHAVAEHNERLDLFDPNAEYAQRPLVMESGRYRGNRNSRPRLEVLDGLMSAIETGEPEEHPSWAMQASVLALSTAVLLVTPPVGIAMLTYTALRQGEGIFATSPDMPGASTRRMHASAA